MLFGQAGRDTFGFANGSGQDTILDFFDGRDVIDLSGYAGITFFAQISEQASGSGLNTVIDLGAASGGTGGLDVLTLANFSLTSLEETDFIFGAV